MAMEESQILPGMYGEIIIVSVVVCTNAILLTPTVLPRDLHCIAGGLQKRGSTNRNTTWIPKTTHSVLFTPSLPPSFLPSYFPLTRCWRLVALVENGV